MTDLEFTDPPPEAPASRPHYTRYAAIAATLKEHPGVWAKAFRRGTQGSARSAAYGIKRGGDLYAAYAPRGAFEATYGQVEGEWWVWVRFVGDLDTEGG